MHGQNRFIEKFQGPKIISLNFPGRCFISGFYDLNGFSDKFVNFYSSEVGTSFNYSCCLASKFILQTGSFALSKLVSYLWEVIYIFGLFCEAFFINFHTSGRLVVLCHFHLKTVPKKSNFKMFLGCQKRHEIITKTAKTFPVESFTTFTTFVLSFMVR